jgi:hypothetical protein
MRPPHDGLSAETCPSTATDTSYAFWSSMPVAHTIASWPVEVLSEVFEQVLEDPIYPRSKSVAGCVLVCHGWKVRPCAITSTIPVEIAYLCRSPLIAFYMQPWCSESIHLRGSLLHSSKLSCITDVSYIMSRFYAYAMPRTSQRRSSLSTWQILSRGPSIYKSYAPTALEVRITASQGQP